MALHMDMHSRFWMRRGRQEVLKIQKIKQVRSLLFTTAVFTADDSPRSRR